MVDERVVSSDVGKGDWRVEKWEIQTDNVWGEDWEMAWEL